MFCSKEGKYAILLNWNWASLMRTFFLCWQVAGLLVNLCWSVFFFSVDGSSDTGHSWKTGRNLGCKALVDLPYLFIWQFKWDKCVDAEYYHVFPKKTGSRKVNSTWFHCYSFPKNQTRGNETDATEEHARFLKSCIWHYFTFFLL